MSTMSFLSMPERAINGFVRGTQRSSFLKGIAAFGVFLSGGMLSVRPAYAGTVGSSSSGCGAPDRTHAVARLVPSVDPLESIRDHPVVGHAMPERRYLGRVIVELFDGPQPDSRNIAYRIDPIGNMSSDELVERVSNALSARLRWPRPR